ncbi:MAG: molybdate ABC transporter substrate-binding protein [Nocardioides sp.]
MRNRLAVALLALVPVLGTAACSGSGGSGARDETGTLTVLAASSLTGTFTELKKEFETEHPGATVKLAFDSSATLAEQVSQGAPADVLATADQKTMQTVVDAGGTTGTPQVFATNRLTMVVPKANPATLSSFADLAKPGVRYVVCVPTAPCGALAQTQLRANGITAKPSSEEVDVKAVLSKVELGEADAGLVYVTDAVAAGDKVRRIDVPTSGDTLNRYPIAALSGAKEPTLAKEWVDLVLSEQGRQVLRTAGFGSP